jgi:hypothetical protein
MIKDCFIEESEGVGIQKPDCTTFDIWAIELLAHGINKMINIICDNIHLFRLSLYASFDDNNDAIK